MSKVQTSTLIALIKRSKDIGNGWRECSDICWDLIEDVKRPDLFERDHFNQRVRIKPEPKKKPTIDDLLNQIYEWREKTWMELKLHDRKLEAQKMAKKLFMYDP